MLKKSIIAALLAVYVFLPNGVFAQGAYWKVKVDQFRILPNPKGEICFLGDSITDGCCWTELTGNPKVTNRGIGGDTAAWVLDRVDEVTEGKPAKVFLMIGTNDLAWADKTVPETADNIAKIIDAIQKQSPQTRIYLQSVLPVIDGRNDKFDNKDIEAINPLLVKIAAAKKVTFIDLAPSFKDAGGQLKPEFTEDGLHLNGKAYLVWYGQIKQYLK
jgi:lysophospholipase L1-like esterase